jgi:hypothetical protein
MTEQKLTSTHRTSLQDTFATAVCKTALSRLYEQQFTTITIFCPCTIAITCKSNTKCITAPFNGENIIFPTLSEKFIFAKKSLFREILTVLTRLRQCDDFTYA